MLRHKLRGSRTRGVAASVAAALVIGTLAAPGAAQAAGPFVSDDFSAASLDPRWEVIRPDNLGSATVTDAQLLLALPAGASHDPWNSNDVVRAVQAVTDGDYGIEAKFDSVPSQGMQLQGLTFEQNPTSFLRFEVHHNGSQLRLFASATVDGKPKKYLDTALPALSAVYLRVVRSGDSWTLSWSETGTAWTTGVTFSRAMTIAKIGPYVGNYADSGDAPAYTARVDYVLSTASEIPPDDGDDGGPAEPPTGDTTPPVVGNIASAPGASSAQISWSTDEAASGLVEYGPTTAYGSQVSNAQAQTAQSVVLPNLTAGTLYHYRVVATDAAGNATTTGDRTFTTVAAGSFVSDDFSAATLGAVWELVKPKGVGSATLTGSGTADARLALTVPPGVDHDPWKSNDVVRVVQPVTNSDLTVEAGFDSYPTTRYQLQGITFEESPTSFVRFDVHHNGSQPRLYASTTVNGKPTKRIDIAMPVLSKVHLRAVRAGATWTMLWSADGTEWTTAGSFSHDITVNRVGPYVGTVGDDGNAPGFTALVDYVFDTASPIVPEDGFEGPPPPVDTTGPEVSTPSLQASMTSAQVAWSTNEIAVGKVQYGPSASYGSTSANTVAGLNHSVVLPALSPGTTYHYRVVATDEAGNVTTTDDATFTTPTSNTGPAIDVWYGSTQTFGPPKKGQDWVNVLGNVSDPDGVTSLTYSLNGGAAQPLVIGPDKRRLQWLGDFNVDLRFADLNTGNNTVLLKAVDGNGAESQQSVTVVRSTSAAGTLPYSLDWDTGAPLASQAQVVDGKWKVTSAGVRTDITGYDRIISLGDVGWTDYELTVPVTVHSFGPAAYSHLSGAPLIGVGMRWHGHTAVDSARPAWSWFPTGAFAWYRFYEAGGKFELRGNNDSPVKYTKPPFALGTTYVLKVRAQDVGSATRYQVKIWPQGDAEPGSWLASIDVTDGPDDGAVALIAHQLDGTFGDVTVSPL